MFVEGAQVTVTDSTGAEVGSATSDAEGRVRIEVSGPGTYTVTLDEATLPEEVAIAPGRVSRGLDDHRGGTDRQRHLPDPVRRGHLGVERRRHHPAPHPPVGGGGHQDRPLPRPRRHWPVADLRHDGPGQLRPRRDDHLRHAGRLLLQLLRLRRHRRLPEGRPSGARRRREPRVGDRAGDHRRRRPRLPPRRPAVRADAPQGRQQRRRARVHDRPGHLHALRLPVHRRRQPPLLPRLLRPAGARSRPRGDHPEGPHRRRRRHRGAHRGRPPAPADPHRQGHAGRLGQPRPSPRRPASTCSGSSASSGWQVARSPRSAASSSG